MDDSSDGDWFEVQMCMGVEPKGNRGTAVVHLKQDDPFSDSARFFRSAVVVMMNPAGVIDRDLVFDRPCQDWRPGDDDHVSLYLILRLFKQTVPEGLKSFLIVAPGSVSDSIAVSSNETDNGRRSL